MYGLLTAFERDVRNLLQAYVIPAIGEEAALGELRRVALKRRLDVGDEEDVPAVEYLDLRPAFDLLNRHRRYLPEPLAKEARDLTQQLDTIVPIRHRVMHARPLRDQDPEHLLSSLRMFGDSHWRTLRNDLSSLAHDSDWEPVQEISLLPDKVLHNLPYAEYDETGLLGRDDAVDRILAILRGRDTVLTITGEGGIGKTALALECASRMLDDSRQPFDVVLWVSLKTERLTGNGIQQLRRAATSLIGAVEQLGKGIDPSFVGGIEMLREVLEGQNTLICIDNLESITGDDFVQLYEGLPDTAKYLITSREGIGQIERRFDLGPLAKKPALALLGQMISLRSVPALQRLSTLAREQILDRLRFSPLAIRWFVLSTEAGRNPRDTVLNQDELVDYCVGSVFRGLDDNSREVLIALHTLGRQATADDMVLLTGRTARHVQTALQKLTRGSLVQYVNNAVGGTGDLKLTVEETPTARLYLDHHISSNDPIAVLVAHNDEKFLQQEEIRRRQESNRSLAPSVVRIRDASDAATAQLLRSALSYTKKEDIDKAKGFIREAQELNPEFFEVARVDAFLQATAGNYSKATSRYREAYELAEDVEHRAAVAHFFAGHLARNERRIEEAIKFEREAHAVLETEEASVQLGVYLTWIDEFAEAEELLANATKSAHGKQRLIAVSALAKLHKRAGEWSLNESGDFANAWRRALHGYEIAMHALSGKRDTRLLDVAADCACLALEAGMAAARESQSPSDFAAFAEALVSDAPILRRSSKAQRLERAARRSVLTPLPPGPTSAIVSSMNTSDSDSRDEEPPELPIPPPIARDEPAGWYCGEIISIRDNFGFIRHEDFEHNVFFHKTALPRDLDIHALVEGDPVWFSDVDANTDTGGRKAAVASSVQPPDVD